MTNELIIITGRNVLNRDSNTVKTGTITTTIDYSTSTIDSDSSSDSSSGGDSDSNSVENGPYRLSNEVQNVLIEDFYPPISSSTVPGNPGRLIVKLSDFN